MTNDATAKRIAITRWIVGVGVFLLAGLAGYVLYSRFVDTSGPGEPTADDQRLASFLTQGEQRLAAGDLAGAKEQFLKASGLAEGDPRVLRGMAHTAVLRAELAWWDFASQSQEQRPAALRELGSATQAATDAIAAAVAKAPEEGVSVQLNAQGFQLEALYVYALARAAKTAPARQRLDQLASRQPGHPLVASLRRLMGPAPKPAPTSHADAGPPAAASSVAAGPKPPAGNAYHPPETYEFNHEPVPTSKVPGELEIPAGTAPVEQPAPDTSDLP